MSVDQIYKVIDVIMSNLSAPTLRCTQAGSGSSSVVSKSHIRKGGSGGWRKYFSEEQEASFDAEHARWMEGKRLKSGALLELQFV